MRSLTTYGELEAWSNSIAALLSPFLRGESIVAILLPRNSPRLYAAQLAVLKAGAAYTCLDVSFPDQRMREILEDADSVVLLTDAATRHRALGLGMDPQHVLEVTEVSDEARLSQPKQTEARAEVRPPWLSTVSMAYVVYTSGTTGRPKGVVVEHGSIVNLVNSDMDAFQLGPEDRVAQGSSASYDSSVEEIWLAWAMGAAVVVMDEETSRLGPDLIPWLRHERITVFCPPPTLLRATGCESPQTALPDLRLLYVGGEPLPSDVVDRWAPGRRLVNGYGPTECTVTCLRAGVEIGERITIGKPVSGMKAWVLAETLEEVPHGSSGELCLGGIGVARGYWNRPELTAEKFITHPRFGRIYRTGDLVKRDERGFFFYQGRMDSQVKLRGYRIELGEIELRLAECPGVRSAACCVQEDQGQAALVAFVVPVAATEPPPIDLLKSALAKVLPAYMVPGRFGFLSELPTTVGGKLNRAALPRVREGVVTKEKAITLPRTPLETKFQAAFRQVLHRPSDACIHEDFFNDLGGDSLTAAQLVSLLRYNASTAWVAVRDIYEARTIAALAERAPQPNLSQSSKAPSSERGQREEVKRLTRLFTFCVQGLWILKSLIVGALLAYFGTFYLLPPAMATLGLIPLLLIAPVAILAGLVLYTLLSLGAAVGVKRLLIGAYRPTRAPVWGGFYLRNWIVQRAVKQVPWWLIEGTEFQNAALRALGARIGPRAHIHRGVDLLRGGWDLLVIGEDATLGQDVALGLVEYDAGQIVVGGVTLEAGSTLETHSYAGAGACVERNGFLSARASLSFGARIGVGERWDGIPARFAGTAPEPSPVPASERVLSPLRAGSWMVAARLTLLVALAVPAECFAVGLAWCFELTSASASAWLASPTLTGELLLGFLALGVLPVPFMLALEAIACRVMGQVQPGVISRWGVGYVRVWLKSGLVDSGSRWLYGTLFWPFWLRLAGMKVGQGCEISSLIDTVPELVEIGDQTFCADGIYLGGARVHRGSVKLSACGLGRNNFLGNGVIIPGGVRLPDDVLLGVCTVADGASMRAGTSWFGHPAFELPRRQVIQFDRRLTHTPSAVRMGVRLFWELLRFALPVALALIIPVWYSVLMLAERSLPVVVLLLVAIPLLNAAALAATTLVVIASKWVLLGRVRPGVHPLWSSWASRWDFVCLMWNLYAVDVVGTLDGTPWLPWLLRAMGMRVGKGVVLGGGFAEDLPDPDMLTLEDGATVGCLFQAHTFEDRVLKLDRITVGRSATVDRNAVLLYGSDIGAASYVAPNSVVMKEERLLPGLRYEGVPIHVMSEGT